MINKTTIETMMQNTLLHSLISKPVQGQPAVAYWTAFNREGNSIMTLGDYRI